MNWQRACCLTSQISSILVAMPCKFVGNDSFCSTHYKLCGSSHLLFTGTLWMQEPLYMSILTSSYRNALSLFLADQFGDIWVTRSWRFHYGVISCVGWIWCACSLIYDLSSGLEVGPWSPSVNWQSSDLLRLCSKACLNCVSPFSCVVDHFRDIWAVRRS
jgi:hypothetical protein